MSAPTNTAPTASTRTRGATPPARRPGARLVGLARAELTLLLRNRMQLATALVMPLVLPLLYIPSARAGADGEQLANALGMMFVIALLFVVYYNLICAYVARRQDLVLKRLRTGEASDATVLGATAVPALVIAIVMITLMGAIAIPLLDLPLPRYPGLIAAALVLGALLMVPLALATTNITRTVESAQVTSLPLMAIAIIGTGAAIPLETMPDWFQRLVAVVPSAPLVDLIRAGWIGIDADGAALAGADLWRTAAVAAVILLAWLGMALWFVRTRFRWEPRA